MNKPKILIVDDQPKNLFALEKVLNKVNAEVIKAGSGNDALKETLRHRFALAILDVQMPEMDGYELAELMRSEEKIKHIPIIFLSAVYSDETHVFKGYKSGAVDFLTKPFSPEILRNKVKIFIELDRYKYELEELVRERTDELKKAKEKAELANRLKSEFLSNISHELRTPLTSIIGFPDIINDTLKKSSGIPDKELNTAIQCNRIVISQSKKLLSLINDLIDLTNIETEQLHLEEDTVLAHDLVAAVLTTHQSMAEEKDITLTDNRSELDDFFFLGDGKRLVKVLDKLVENAIKFSEKGTVKLSALPKGDQIIFQVRDEGIGITKDEAKTIFKQFHQVDGSSTRRYGGLGLGLSLAKSLVEKMGGSISVESLGGKGSTFTVRFPKKLPMAKEPKEIIPEKITWVPNGKKILLVEDDWHTRYLIKSMLSGAEFAVAENGFKALNILKESLDFEVILLDRLMPVMDGDEFMKEVVSRHPGLNIPVIMLTAAASREKVDSAENLARELGLKFKYVVKPFTKDCIFAALAEVGVR